MEAVRVDQMQLSDLTSIVTLQLAYLDGSIVTELGPRFLERFHARTLECASSSAFVARDQQGRIVGFAVASADMDEFNHHVKPRILGSLARALLAPSRWRLIPSMARSLREPSPSPRIEAELLLLVVDAAARRKGIGAALIEAVESDFAQRRIERYRVAVRGHLAVARAFYTTLQFQHEQERLVLGRPMVYLTKRIARS